MSHPQGGGERKGELARGLAWCNRIAGAALGVCCSAALCLGLACLGSAVRFAVAVPAQPVPKAAPSVPAAPAPKWADAVRAASAELADLADRALLRHIPGVRGCSDEVRSLITLMNAPKEKLQRLAETRGLLQLADLPEVQEALADAHYLDLIARMSKGDLAVLPLLVQSRVTRSVVASPRVRELVKDLTPSKLVADLETKLGAAPTASDAKEAHP